MAKTLDLQPSKIVLTDDTTLDAHQLYANNAVLDINRAISTIGVKARASSDLYFQLKPSKALFIRDDSGVNIVEMFEDTGILTLPLQPLTFAYITGGDQSIPSSSYTKIHFNAILFDRQNEFDASVNYRYTATRDGYYLFIVGLLWSAATAGGSGRAWLYKNGSGTIETDVVRLSTVQEMACRGSVILNAVAGDYFEVYGLQETGGAVNVNDGAAFSYFIIYKIA